ncbi:MAG: hypothetical protein VX498_10795 [Myxococcota bacterium]|nr:hypothetical protein [Myxococcota bacterium]
MSQYRTVHASRPQGAALTTVLLLASLLVACPTPPPDGPPEPPTGPVAWQRGQPELDPGTTLRGMRELRAIVHLHSHWSHDACDGDPQPGGVPDEDCLTDLREALCTTRIDLAFLSDHPTHADEAPLQDRLLHRDQDQLVLDSEGRAVGNRLVCDNGHTSLLLPGVEGDLMPLGITEDLPQAWNNRTPEAVQELKDSGAVVWTGHTEVRSLEELAELQADGLELYQLHANLDPDIREDHLGLEPFGYLGEVAPFFFPEPNGIFDPPHPDLAPLGFLELNEPSIVALETLGLTRRLGISGGTDAHQNVFPTAASDGERIDSYRRMLRWFNNRLRIEGDLTPETARAALKAGQNHILFEVFGSAVGFDFHAEMGGEIAEMGEELLLDRGIANLRVELPALDSRSPQGPSAPVIVGRLYRATDQGRELLQEWSDGPLDLSVTQAGIYRVEVWITPFHLEPYLGEVAADYMGNPIPWIQSNAIFLRE